MRTADAGIITKCFKTNPPSSSITKEHHSYSSILSFLCASMYATSLGPTLATSWSSMPATSASAEAAADMVYSMTLASAVAPLNTAIRPRRDGVKPIPHAAGTRSYDHACVMVSASSSRHDSTMLPLMMRSLLDTTLTSAMPAHFIVQSDATRQDAALLAATLKRALFENHVALAMVVTKGNICEERESKVASKATVAPICSDQVTKPG